MKVRCETTAFTELLTRKPTEDVALVQSTVRMDSSASLMFATG